MSNIFLRDLSWNYISFFIIAFCGILINLIITKFSGISSLGIVNQVLAVYILGAQVGMLGISFSALHSISKKNRQIDYKLIATAALIATIVPASLVSILIYLSSDYLSFILESDEVGSGIRLIAPGLFFFALNKVSFAVINGMRKMKVYAFFQTLRYVIILLIISILLYKEVAASMLLLSFVASEVFLFIISIRFLYKQFIGVSFSFKQLMPHIKKHYRFGLKGFSSGTLIELNTRVDVLMLGYFLGDAYVGIYSFAAMIAEGLKEIPNVVRRNIDPIIGNLVAVGSKVKITALSKKIRLFLVPVMMSLALIGVLLYKPFINVFQFDLALLSGANILLILVVGVVLNSIYSPMMGILLQSNRPGYHSLLILCTFLTNIILNYFLIQNYGLLGAAIATAVVFSLEGIILKILVFYQLKIRI
jgi:O-antigen/teichoic acid export membrane protein